MIKERLISALIATCFFAVFQPFGIHKFGWFGWVLVLGIGVMTAAICVLSELVLRYVCRLPNDPDRGTQYIMKRNRVYQVINIVLLTAGIAGYIHFFVNKPEADVDNHLTLHGVLSSFVIVLCISVIVGLYWRNVYWKRHYSHELQEAQRLNGILQERERNRQLQEAQTGNAEAERPATTPILIEGSTKEKLGLMPDDFLFAEADGNYIHIHYLLEGKEHKASIRSSMKSVAEKLCAVPGIMQCHRAFIVNLASVTRIEGRSSGIALALRHVASPVPVSKAYVAEVKQRIQDPS